MPTDYACQAAIALAAQSLDPARAFVETSHPSGRRTHDAPDLSAGTAGLLAILDGLYAELTGQLSGWHAGVRDEISGAFGNPVAAIESIRPVGQPREWERCTLVQIKAQEVLTALASRPRGAPVRPGHLSWRLDLVEDAFAGALRRIAVPEGISVRCASGLAAAAGSLFGLHPSRPPQATQPPPAQEPPQPPQTAASLPARPPGWLGGLP
ncbi:hypothetical protein J7E88_28475 [Streptomyces sp. ISL-10]|uniref:hypothetical protein n=1 Tax=Streptomyces sp. ISL-10 TaxID=2819172 RepID=UPI001BEC9E3A|nr:hypothetical protein [Streptomyces sp. ISL-10]MBT2369145.1 hypothetical protein [Streptomyces sp. ISL-10]